MTVKAMANQLVHQHTTTPPVAAAPAPAPAVSAVPEAPPLIPSVPVNSKLADFVNRTLTEIGEKYRRQQQAFNGNKDTIKQYLEHAAATTGWVEYNIGVQKSLTENKMPKLPPEEVQSIKENFDTKMTALVESIKIVAAAVEKLQAAHVYVQERINSIIPEQIQGDKPLFARFNRAKALEGDLLKKIMLTRANQITLEKFRDYHIQAREDSFGRWSGPTLAESVSSYLPSWPFGASSSSSKAAPDTSSNTNAPSGPTNKDTPPGGPHDPNKDKGNAAPVGLDSEMLKQLAGKGFKQVIGEDGSITFRRIQPPTPPPPPPPPPSARALAAAATSSNGV